MLANFEVFDAPYIKSFKYAKMAYEEADSLFIYDGIAGTLEWRKGKSHKAKFNEDKNQKIPGLLDGSGLWIIVIKGSWYSLYEIVMTIILKSRLKDGVHAYFHNGNPFDLRPVNLVAVRSPGPVMSRRSGPGVYIAPGISGEPDRVFAMVRRDGEYIYLGAFGVDCRRNCGRAGFSIKKLRGTPGGKVIAIGGRHG